MKTPPPTDPNKLVLFTLYAFLIGLAAAFTPEAIKSVSGVSEEAAKWHPELWLLGTTACLVLCFVGFDPAVKRWFRPRYSPTPLHLTTHYTVRSARGLLLLISRGDGIHSARSAVAYHARTLSHLWLVHSSDPGSVEGTAQITKYCADVAPTAVVQTCHLHNLFSIAIAKALVDGIRGEARSAGIENADFICDFTGMNKPVSAGVVLACIRPGHRLQYMEPMAFLPNGAPDSQAGSRPTEVDINYDVDLPEEPASDDL